MSDANGTGYTREQTKNIELQCNLRGDEAVKSGRYLLTGKSPETQSSEL